MFVAIKFALLGTRGDLHWLYTRRTAVLDFEHGPFGLETFRRNLAHIHAICSEQKAKLILGTPPYYHAWAELDKGKVFADGWQRGIDAENKIIRAFAAKTQGVFLAEVAQSFTPSSQEMIDFVHFTAEGNEKIAEAFYKAIISRR